MRRICTLLGLLVGFAIPAYAQPTFVSVGSSSASTLDATPGLPTGWQTDDIFLLFVASANEAVTCPTGYAEVTNSPQGVGTPANFGGTRLTVCWKRATSSESAPTVTDSGDHTFAVIAAFRGCITTGNPWDVTSGSTGNETDLSILGATTTVANTLVVLAAVFDSNATTSSAWVNADLGTIADPEHFDLGTSSGTDSSMVVTSAVKASAGAYTTTTATTSAGVQNRASMSIALKVATAGAASKPCVVGGGILGGCGG